MKINPFSYFLTSLALMFTLTTAPAAQAQFSFDNSEPISATADSADYQGDVTILTGQVDVRQGEVRILGDVMKIYSVGTPQNGEAFGEITRIESIGNFFYITPTQEVRGAKGIYEKNLDRFTVTEDVILVQEGGNVVTGDELIYNLITNEARVTGNCKGRRCGKKGRVSILIKNSGTDSPETR